MRLRIEYLTYFLYFISNLLMLINPGVYWDDWAIYNMDERGIMNQFYGNGVYPIGHLHVFLSNIYGSPLLYNFLAFVLQFTGIYALFRILEGFLIKQRYEGFFFSAVLIYAILPFYDAKITMIVLPYTICLNFFLLATWFLIKYKLNQLPIYRIFSLLLFFISFFTNSLLFFYIVPIYFIFFFETLHTSFPLRRENLSSLKRKLINPVLKYVDFFLLPFVFWAVRLMFFMPSLQYKNISYNEIKPESIFEIPYRIIKFFYVSAISIYPLIRDFLSYWELLVLSIFIIPVIYACLPHFNSKNKISWRMFLWGCAILFIGIFPYLLVNKFPSYGAYSSRHQLLMGFGTSLIVITFIFHLSGVFKKILFSVIIGVFVSFNIYLNFSYFKGYMKQHVFHTAFYSIIPHNKKSTTIIFKDNTTDFTLKGNPVAFYALSGILKKSNPEENIMLIRENDLFKYKSQGLFDQIKPYMFQYNLSNYELKEPTYELEIDYSEIKRPDFPLITFYGNYLKGDKELWISYFDFKLRKIKEK